MNKAVLVIDVQQGLCEGDGAAHDCDGTIRRINLVTQKARAANAPVIFIQHQSKSGYLEYGTREWALANGLHVESKDYKIDKTTPDAFLRTELETLLKSLNVAQIAVCGMHTEFCVDTTVRKALALGYPVELVRDAHTSAGNDAVTPEQAIEHHNATLTNISSFGPKATAVYHDEIVF